MNLGEIMEFVDGVKPNAFEPEDKVRWLNELERRIQTDVLGMKEGLTSHVWSAHWTGTGVCFPDDHTMVIPGILQARAGGTVDIEDLADYANDTEALTVAAAAIGDGVTTLTFADGAFTDTGETGDTGRARIYYDGQTEPMVAPEIFEEVYYSYLEARIAAANGEFGEYANTAQIFNAFRSDYVRWYARNYIDD